MVARRVFRTAHAFVAIGIASTVLSAQGQNAGDVVSISGELRQWHKVTLTLNVPIGRQACQTHSSTIA